MNIRDVADKLNNITYGFEGLVLTLDYCRELRREMIVVIRGDSHGYIQFDGAVSNEFPDEKYYFNSKGIIRNECNSNSCPYFEKHLNDAKYFVESTQSEEGQYVWEFNTNIPHVTFDILNDGEKYCRAIVFKLSDLT